MVSRATGVQGLRIVNQNRSGNGTVTLTHNAQAGATSYELYQCINGRCTIYGKAYSANTPITVRFTNTNQNAYTFKVRSKNACGWSAYSQFL